MDRYDIFDDNMLLIFLVLILLFMGGGLGLGAQY
jgi:hypothetical protein